MLLILNTGYADTDADLCIKIMSLCYNIFFTSQPNTQVPSSDVITSLCGYSSVNEAWKVFVYVNGGASAIGDA